MYTDHLKDTVDGAQLDVGERGELLDHAKGTDNKLSYLLEHADLDESLGGPDSAASEAVRKPGAPETEEKTETAEAAEGKLPPVAKNEDFTVSTTPWKRARWTRSRRARAPWVWAIRGPRSKRRRS